MSGETTRSGRPVRLFLAAMLLMLAPLEASVSKKTTPHEQSDFGGEDEKWDQPARVPDEVLQILRRVENAAPSELPAQWLLASEIHLGPPGELNLIVMGIGGLRGAHSVPFWVFRKKREGYDLVLSTGGDSLKVLNARSNGYRTIKAYNVGQAGRTLTTAAYRFDGRRYQEYKIRTEAINR
jgi:hypothetical protein